MVAGFADPAGGFFDTPVNGELITRMKERYDGAEPSGNSVAAMNLLRLARLTGDTSWQELGRRPSWPPPTSSRNSPPPCR